MSDPLANVPPQVRSALENGNLVQAIKLMREQMPQLGLAEVKSMVEALQRQGVKVNVKAHAKANVSMPHSQPAKAVIPHAHAAMPHVTPGLSPGEVPRTSGSAALVGAAIAIFAVIVAAVYFSG